MKDDLIDTVQNLKSVLLQKFGFNEFRPLQEEIINRILDKKDTVVLMPTGGGKSMCYQLPAIIMDGLTVVISPLIALMRDQVESLKANGIPSEYLNSSLTTAEETAIRSSLKKGELKLLYISPERLFSNGFMEYLKILNVNLFAIDEAHCISSWGHQFRPEYSKLSILKKEFPSIPIVALTATADEAVRSDIGNLLDLEDPRMFISSFDRPNLSLAVLPGIKKWEQLSKILLRNHHQSGIIYCSSRNSTEQLSKKLNQNGYNAAHYHAGVDAAQRNQVQNDFLNDKVQIICATIAFGMGIDKSNIRFVVHYHMPANLEGFYQAVGRAGRDGLSAETVLFYSYRDVQVQMGFIDNIEDDNYRRIRIDKLNRMKEYADAQICRRKILLSYFGEYKKEDCNNCDVCDNPPRYLDGTTLAQMALSAISRVKGKVTLTTLVDILRGTYSREVNEKGYSRIKTFGVGRQTSAFAWQLYLQQFIQQGLIKVDYKEHSQLRLTPLSKGVLHDGIKVRVVNYETIKERQESAKKVDTVKTYNLPLDYDEELYDRLKALRNSIASDMNKPAFVVFSNSALREMSARKPVSMGEFMSINGVGEFKANNYGKEFIELIQSHA